MLSFMSSIPFAAIVLVVPVWIKFTISSSRCRNWERSFFLKRRRSNLFVFTNLIEEIAGSQNITNVVLGERVGGPSALEPAARQRAARRLV
jgi:hypothetical protein